MFRDEEGGGGRGKEIGVEETWCLVSKQIWERGREDDYFKKVSS